MLPNVRINDSDKCNIWGDLDTDYDKCSRPKFSWCAEIAQSVQWLATGWTIWKSNLGMGEIFRTLPYQLWGIHPNSCIMSTGSVPCSKVAGVWRWPPDPKKELTFLGVGWSTPQLGLCGVSRVKFPFFITFRRKLPPRPLTLWRRDFLLNFSTSCI